MKAVDTGKDGIGWGQFLRVKIVVDLSKPLARGRMLKVQGKSKWIPFENAQSTRKIELFSLLSHKPWKN